MMLPGPGVSERGGCVCRGGFAAGRGIGNMQLADVYACRGFRAVTDCVSGFRGGVALVRWPGYQDR